MLSPRLAKQLEGALRGLQYGSVHLVVHDAAVVRIERVERIRLTPHHVAGSAHSVQEDGDDETDR